MKKALILIVTILHFSAFSQEDSSRGYRVKIGDEVPKFDLNMIDGSKINIDDLKGKIVVLQFTASWCGVCIKEMPHLEKEVWQRFKNDDFILIAVDLKEKKSKILPFVEKTGITYPVAMDKDGSIFDSFTYPKAGVTRNIVIDRNGKIIYLTRLFEKKEFNAMIKRIEKEINT
jgi:peroxiredoxin